MSADERHSWPALLLQTYLLLWLTLLQQRVEAISPGSRACIIGPVHNLNTILCGCKVEYLERGWVSGRIPGTLRRREMTGERETATAALIEDALRPLFPEGFESPCQVSCLLYPQLSADLHKSASGACLKHV